MASIIVRRNSQDIEREVVSQYVGSFDAATGELDGQVNVRGNTKVAPLVPVVSDAIDTHLFMNEKRRVCMSRSARYRARPYVSASDLLGFETIF